MFKKLILSCMAVFALAAVVLPAVASATNTPTLRDSGGVVAVGSKIYGLNSGNTIFYNTSTSTAQVTCTTAKLSGEVTANGNDTVEGKISTAAFSGTGGVFHNGLNECTDSFGIGAAITVVNLPLTIKSNKAMATHEFQVTGNGGNIVFQIKDTSIGTCQYKATNASILGDYTTGSAAAPSTLSTRDTEAGSGAKLQRVPEVPTEPSFFCPPSGVLKMNFHVFTEAGNAAVWITQT